MSLFARRDVFAIIFLSIAVLAIFYPVFYAEYLYTDEATQLWFNAKGVNITSIEQGRFITYIILKSLFSAIHTIQDVIHARVFSLTACIICLPVWYYIIRSVVMKNGLPLVIVLLSCVYMICMPAFSIYIGWASCLQIFIACTAGLVSGYALYKGLKYKDNKIYIFPIQYVILSAIAGIVSLFTYQNGFGCFFIPFFIQFIAAKKFAKNIFIAIGCSFIIYGLYFFLFKYSIWIHGITESNRNAFTANPLKKLIFLFTRPLAASFHFTWLINEKSYSGIILYIIVFSFWLAANLMMLHSRRLSEKVSYFSGIIVFFILAYLPSLLVVENYPSNRTLFALNFIVFILVGETFFSYVKGYKWQYTIACIITLFFLTNAWYNFHFQFIKPLTEEYRLIKKVIAQNYSIDIDTVYFIRPAENAFVKKYGIVASWDEFGVPSSSKTWTPEPLIKQLVFEKTKSRQIAERLIVKSWEGSEAFLKSGATIARGTLLIDMEKIIGEP